MKITYPKLKDLRENTRLETNLETGIYWTGVFFNSIIPVILTWISVQLTTWYLIPVILVLMLARVQE